MGTGAVVLAENSLKLVGSVDGLGKVEGIEAEEETMLLEGDSVAVSTPIGRSGLVEASGVLEDGEGSGEVDGL